MLYKIEKFIKNRKVLIIAIILAWGIILVINYTLKNSKNIELQTTYKPHTAVMDTTDTVPTKLQNPIEELLEKYFEFCNNKEYEQAYNLINEECRTRVFSKLDNFKIYIDSIFTGKKTYNIQNYSNVENTYIYRIRILDDILATGLTEEENLKYYEEKITIKEDNGNLELFIKDYVEEIEKDAVYEDEYIKVDLERIIYNYETATYRVKITNRSEYTVALSDNNQINEILLNIGRENRVKKHDFENPIILNSEQIKTFDLVFTRFYDEKIKNESIIFNKVRILKQYNKDEVIDLETENDNIIELYAFELKI